MQTDTKDPVDEGVVEFAVVIDGLSKPLVVKLAPDDDGLSSWKTEDLAGTPMVRIGAWRVSRDRIVAIVPESVAKRTVRVR